MNPQEYAGRTREKLIIGGLWEERVIIGALLDQVADGGATALLNLGCDTGANLPFFCEHIDVSGRVTPLDYSPLALDFAKEKTRELF